MANDGHKFENQVIERLDNASISKMPENVKYLLEKVFGTLKKRSTVKCRHAEDFTKPDIIISYKDEEAYVSLKTGTACEVHKEKIETLIPFLRTCGVSEQTLKTIVLFQFGDGTYDGSGAHRRDSNETFHWLRERIKAANEELNTNPEIIKAVMQRCLFQGVNPQAKPAKYIYHGSLSDGILISDNQIEKYVDRKNFLFLENLHIGPLLLRPHARYANKRVLNEKSRREMTLYWPNFRVDLEYIDKRFGF